MTNIELTKVNNNHIVIAKGHATGSTEVCSAISMMIYSLLGYLTNYSKENLVKSIEDGKAIVEFINNEDIYNFIKIGFLQLEQSNPKYVKVKIVEDV